MGFSKDFIWGAASSSYQIEGAAYEDGKGLSVWDIFCRKPDVIRNNQTGDIACDHYHRYAEDVALMKEIGIKAYRFSISWPRILPDGTGKINEKGLDFYKRLVDELLKNGIEPYITLFHWDYPYELYKKGGWLNSESPDWFSEYTRIVVENLSDRVKNWMTLNEPQCFILLGHDIGKHAPGVKLGFTEVLQATHNSLLAHGKSVQAINSFSKQKCIIGYAPVGQTAVPETNSLEDIEAARIYMFESFEKNKFVNSLWMDPVILGSYPEKLLKSLEQWMPDIKQDDLKTICQPIDYLGVNIYTAPNVFLRNGDMEYSPKKNGFARTAINWSVEPESLYWGPKLFHERYKIPIVITENGLSNTDWVSLDGKVHDPQRMDFMDRYIGSLKRAASDGVDVKGYFHWSIMDNFEWGEGYNERFGLIHVDYETQKRTIKDSAYRYKSIIESNGDILG